MALVPISVFAAGLGKLNVMSGLGEPLKADIELISVTPEELNSITAAIASDEAYATQGIEKTASLNGFNF
jgi:pilus assembly protein FimV